MSTHLKNTALLVLIVVANIILSLGNVYATETAKAPPSVVGSWTVSGHSSLAYNIPHVISKTKVLPESGTETFNSDGAFTGTDGFSGTWTQKGTSYTLLNLQQSQISFIEQLLTEYGVTGTVTIKTDKVGGTVSATKITLTARVTGTVAVTFPITATASFTETLILSGKRATSAEDRIAADEEDIHEGLSDSLKEMVNDIAGQ